MSFLDALDPHWKITAYYALIFLFLFALAKLASAVVSRVSLLQRLVFLATAPTLSINTWLRARPAKIGDLRRLAVSAALVFPAIIAVYALLPQAISQPEMPWCARAYAAIIPFWLLTETLSIATQLVFLALGIYLPPFHQMPWKARSLSDFWGRRWNLLFSDWFRQVCFQPLRHRPMTAVFLVFAISAAMHECLVNVPLLAVFGTNLLGSMFVYFGFQAVGIFFEKRWLHHYPLPQRLFLWLTVLAPVPFVLNEGTLRIFHLIA